MPRVLLIANNYYNKECVASNRTSGLLKYLHEYGWEVTLITYHPLHVEPFLGFSNKNIVTVVHRFPQLTNNEKQSIVSECPKTSRIVHGYVDIRGAQSAHTILNNICNMVKKVPIIEKNMGKILNIYNIIQYPISNDAHWKRAVIHHGQEICTTEHIDAILSTHNLAESHIGASIISQRYNIPWVADYRDLWSQNHYTTYSNWRRKKVQKQEIQVIKPATTLTTINNNMAEDLVKLHNKPVVDIPNGYDPETVNSGSILRPKFTITYLGILYDGKRNPEPLFKVISELIMENRIAESEISIDFYGPESSILQKTIEKHGLQNCTHQHGLISKNESINMQRTSQILLLLTWNHPKEAGGCPGKVFEYFAARRPILSLGYVGECYLSKILKETNAGIHISNHENLKETLLHWYDEWKQSGIVTYHGIDERLDEYSHRAMARKFADVLNNAVKSRQISVNSYK